jgi:threonine-phosphate decarboxylase
MITDPVVQKYQKPAVQCFHGGQSFRSCANFKCDFSVTTNLSGPPKCAVTASLDALKDIEHYPDQESWEARCHLADVSNIWPEEILLGNGASEFIDIVPRLFRRGSEWRPGPWPAQFMEYERAAHNAGLVKTPWTNRDAVLTIMINPNSPTGDFIPFNEVRAMIQRDSKSTFLIDESFMPCFGPRWMDESAMQLISEFGGRVIIIASWTKVLACPLMRIGTVASSKHIINQIVKVQVPWGVNGLAQSFMIAALHDVNYFDEMWRVTPIWKRILSDLVTQVGFRVNENSPLWVPFVYIDMLDPAIAAQAEKVAFQAGYPIRVCASFGQPQFVRLGVRIPRHARGLQQAWLRDERLTEMIREFHANRD